MSEKKEVEKNITSKDYAVINFSGKEYRVSEGDVIDFPVHVKQEKGSEIIFDSVLLIKSGDTSIIGTPVVEGAKVTGTVMLETRSKKITVFKKKRRQGYKKKQGHREPVSRIKIEALTAKG